MRCGIAQSTVIENILTVGEKQMTEPSPVLDAPQPEFEGLVRKFVKLTDFKQL